MGAASCFETAASPPPQHEGGWAGAACARAGTHGAPVGKCYHVRALHRHALATVIVMPGLDPGIHRKKHFKRRRWIAGSSPAMTADGSALSPTCCDFVRA